MRASISDHFTVFFVTSLAAFLWAEAAKPYKIGESDCLMLVCGWIALNRGVDPGAFCRGYDEAKAAELISQWGPLPRAMGRVLRRAGFSLTQDPQPGDIAAIALDGLAHSAIRTSRGWVTRLETGLALLPLDRVRVVAAWRV